MRIVPPLPGLPPWPFVPEPTPQLTSEKTPSDGMLAGSYSNAAGERPYRLFVPAERIEAAPLVVMLHGCSQSPEDFAAGTRMNAAAARHGCLVLYPGQTRRANPLGCWNWFDEDSQIRGHGESSVIAGMTRAVMCRYGVDPRRVYVAGLSAGGAQAVIMAIAYADLYAAVGVHSGLPCGVARDAASAMAAMRGETPPGATAAGTGGRSPAIVFHGDSDHTVDVANAAAVISQLAGSGLRANEATGATPGGRAFTRTVYADDAGRTVAERWTVHGGAHAWSGGSADGSFTDPSGPDATAQMLRFFLQHPRATAD